MFLKQTLLNPTFYSLILKKNYSQHYKLVIVGGGSGGISVASKFSKILKNELSIIEPQDTHYYQPLFTLVGAGVKKLSDTCKLTKDLIPKNTEWIKHKVAQFNPKENSLVLDNGSKINYDYLVVATGIELDFKSIKGLEKALETEQAEVCSIYSPKTVEKTWKCISNFKGGNAVFTFPNTSIKCAGAPQKIMYLSENFFRNKNIRDKTNVIFNTSLDKIFSISKYAKVLNEIIESRKINVNFKHNLIKIDSDNKKATFLNLDTNEKIIQDYDLLHVTPPQKPFEFLKPLANQTGFVDVNKYTLQHNQYQNIFSIGDCCDLPTSKTGAAVAAQINVLYKNLLAVMNNQESNSQYDGYTSCPLVTSYGKCVLAEFDYDLKPLETFPFNQAKERRTMYFAKKNILPFVYWNLMLKGYWHGPAAFRKALSIFKTS